MQALFWIGLGSAAGGIARHLVSLSVSARFGEAFPWGTLVVNVVGSFLIALVAGLADPSSRLMVPAAARQFLAVGVMGGFTTFSSFSLQTLNLLRDGQLAYAGLNVGLSLLLCLIGAWLGLQAASAIAS